MPRIIVKCKYIKGAKHRSFYTNYIATRENVEKINNSFGKADETTKQKEMIQQMLKDYPDTIKMFEYEDYMKNPNRENASELISAVIDHNLEQIATKENYVDYIANRPRVEKLGEHGMFSDENTPIHLKELSNEVAQHEGTVWTNIISLKRSDATRLGYDNAKSWMNLCRAKRNEIAKTMQIDPNNFKWYAAFHNEKHHPHIHMIVYSKDSKQGYLTKEGIQKQRSIFANTIFKQDMLNIYKSQTEVRDSIKRLSQERLKALLSSLQKPMQDHMEINQKVASLYEAIKEHKGKLVYGFLKPETKKMVDDIVMLLEKEERIQELYNDWYLYKENIHENYHDYLEKRIPLHMQKEFKSIKNMILKEVATLSFESTSFAELKDTNDKIIDFDNENRMYDALDTYQDSGIKNQKYYMEWNQTYQDALLCLYSEKDLDYAKGIDHLEYEAERGNVLALSELGKIYQKGIADTEKDEDKANDYYAQSFKGFQNLLNSSDKKQKYIAYRIGKFYMYGLGIEKNYEKAIDYFLQSKNQYAYNLLGNIYHFGLGVEANQYIAVSYYEKSALKGNCYAQYELATAYATGNGALLNEDEANEYYTKAYQGFLLLAEKNQDDHLLYRLGKMNYLGQGTERNVKEAIRYLQSALKLKNENAIYLLAKLWLQENYFEHFEEAREMLESLEEKEEALFLLGKEYLNGEHFECDLTKAIFYLEKCSKLGNNYADYMLYKAYHLLEDSSKALYYLQRSAENGNAIAQFQIGKQLLERHQETKAEAIKWLEASAKQNNMFAQYTLGKLFLFGNEVEKNEEMAIFYLEASTRQGNEYALWLLEHKDDYQQQPLTLVTSRFFHHLSRVFEQSMLPKQENPLLHIDRKTRRKLMLKHSALGHKEDDHTLNI